MIIEKEHTLQQPSLKKTPKGGRSIARRISKKIAHLEAIFRFNNSWRR